MCVSFVHPAVFHGLTLAVSNIASGDGSMVRKPSYLEYFELWDNLLNGVGDGAIRQRVRTEVVGPQASAPAKPAAADSKGVLGLVSRAVGL